MLHGFHDPMSIRSFASGKSDDHKMLSAHRTLLRVGISLAGSFAWIFLLSYYTLLSGSIAHSIIAVMILYSLAQFVSLLMTPFSASHLRRGVKQAMIFGALCAGAAFIVLGSTFVGMFHSPIGWGTVFFAILLGLYRAFYWIPYRLQRGQDMRDPSMWFELVIASMPLFAGITATTVYLGPERVLWGAGAFAIVSVLPALFIRDHSERFSWHYFETFQRFFSVAHRQASLRAIAEGIQSAALYLVWPIALFLILGRSYLIVGLVMSISLLIVLVLRDWYRKAKRSLGIHSPYTEATIAASAWAFRLTVAGPVGAVIADSYAYVSAPQGTADSEILSFDHAADRGSYIDEYTTLNEIGLAIGRIAMCVVGGIFAFFMQPWIALTFLILIAAFAAGYSAVSARHESARAF